MAKTKGVLWYENGDHPDDDCTMVGPRPSSTTQFTPFLSDGKIVRRHRTPGEFGLELCTICGIMMNMHGFIDVDNSTHEVGETVCPGSMIVKVGSRYEVDMT